MTSLPKPIAHQAVAKRTEKPRVTKKVRAAIDIMVEEGRAFDVAARSAGLTARSMRKALDKPHIIAYLRERKHVFRERASGANIYRLVELRDQDDNRMAATKAVQILEEMGEQRPSQQPGRIVQPEIVIVINHRAQPRPIDETLIEVNPALIEQDDCASV